MQEDPEKSQNFDESEEIEDSDDEFETEEDIRWRWKLRIVALVIIVLCASSMIISVYRRNALGHGDKGELEYDLLSDDDIDADISAPKINDSERIEVNTNENNETNDNSNEGEKKIMDESESDSRQSQPSPDIDNESSSDSEAFHEENENPSPGGSSFINPDPIPEPETIIINEGGDDSTVAERTTTEVETDDRASGEPIIEMGQPTIIEPITVEQNEVEPAGITVVENIKTPTKVPKKMKIYDPEFVDIRAEDSDEDIEEIVKPTTFEEPKGRLYYYGYGRIQSGEFGKYYFCKSSNTDYEFSPLNSKFASVSFTADHKKIAFAMIDEKCGMNKMSKIIVKDLEQMSTLEICGEEGNYCYDPHISPDGKLVIYRKGDWKTLYYYNIETGIETKLDLPPNSMKYKPIFFADCKRFVFVALLNRKFKIVVSNIFNTQKSKCVYESDGRPVDLAISPNGRYIAFIIKDFIQVIAVNDEERLYKKFKFDMPLPSLDDPPKSEYYNSLTQSIMYYVEEVPKFSRPFWSSDSMKLFFTGSDDHLYYTGYGYDKYKTLNYVINDKIFYGIIPDLPKMKTDEIVKSTLDDIIDRVEVLNWIDEDNWINEITLNVDEPVEIQNQDTFTDNNTNANDNETYNDNDTNANDNDGIIDDDESVDIVTNDADNIIDIDDAGIFVVGDADMTTL